MQTRKRFIEKNVIYICLVAMLSQALCKLYIRRLIFLVKLIKKKSFTKYCCIKKNINTITILRERCCNRQKIVTHSLTILVRCYSKLQQYYCKVSIKLAIFRLKMLKKILRKCRNALGKCSSNTAQRLPIEDSQVGQYCLKLY